MKLRGCLFLILVAIAAVYVAYLQTDFLKYREIEVTGVSDQNLIRAHEILEENVKGNHFFSINKIEINALIAQYAPDLKVGAISYTFPNKLSINLEERVEEYVVEASNGVFKIDKEHYVMGVSDSTADAEKIDVIYDEPLGSGEKISDGVLQAGLVYAGLDRKVQISSGEISINLDNGGKVILPTEAAVKRVNELSEVLKKITQKYTIEGKEIKLIDLRFSKPVIKLN